MLRLGMKQGTKGSKRTLLAVGWTVAFVVLMVGGIVAFGYGWWVWVVLGGISLMDYAFLQGRD
jgi:hypothetical protein